jgi:hypothetical protein
MALLTLNLVVYARIVERRRSGARRGGKAGTERGVEGGAPAWVAGRARADAEG